MAELPEIDKYDVLIKQYRELFNAVPPIMGLSYEEANKRMEKAIKAGKPFSEYDDIPGGGGRMRRGRLFNNRRAEM